MPVTPKKSLRYPAGTEVVNRSHIQNLATDIDNNLGFFSQTAHQAVESICYHEDATEQNGNYIVINTTIPLTGSNYHIKLKVLGMNQAKRNVVDMDIVFEVASNTITATAEVANNGGMVFNTVNIMMNNSSGNIVIALIPPAGPSKVAFVVDAEFSGPSAVTAAHMTGWTCARVASLSGHTSFATSPVSDYWKPLTLHYTWENYSAPSGNVNAKVVKTNGVVRVQGTIKRLSGTATHFATLPVGMQPGPGSSTMIFPADDGGAGGRIDVLHNGQMYYQSGNTSYVSLSSVQFPIHL